MDPLVTIPMLVVAAIALIGVPLIVLTRDRARRGVDVLCPDNGELVHVGLDGRRELLRLIRDERAIVTSCTRWPEKAGCARECESDICS